jgi:hypothetical protein
MSSLSISRPEPDEAAQFYHGYIAKVSGERIGALLEGQLQEIDQLFATVTDQAALARYAAGKWSIKETLRPCPGSTRTPTYRPATSIGGHSRCCWPSFAPYA